MSKKILLVEDSPTISTIVTYTLEAAGYEVSTADNGNKALQIMKKETPDLVILDIGLPGGMDGYSVCRFIKTNKKHKTIPVIMFTARGKVGEVDEAFSVGADDYLVKPTNQGDYDRLMTKIEKWIQ
ncbi:MAG: response regulator [Elusimicrobiota bacterium]